VIAHVGPVPLEEILPSVTAAGAGLVLARAWLTLHVRRRRGPGRQPDQERPDVGRVCGQDTIRISWLVLFRRRPPSSVTVTMSSMRTPKRPGRVDAGFDREAHPGLHQPLLPLDRIERLEGGQPDAVAGAVDEVPRMTLGVYAQCMKRSQVDDAVVWQVMHFSDELEKRARETVFGPTNGPTRNSRQARRA
jgi:hypothetical protein